jgi:methyltransferase
MTPLWPQIAILGFVTLQRLAELPVAKRNTRQLIAAGGHEVGASHYPLIVALHASWLASLWVFALGRPIHFPLLALFGLLQIGRIWTLRTLRDRWTTRIIVVPGESLVARGPYRFVSHPNYLVVIGEIAVLPLVFGLLPLAVLFSMLNAVVLAIRVRQENGALRALRG